jgi:hypothetical protein
MIHPEKQHILTRIGWWASNDNDFYNDFKPGKFIMYFKYYDFMTCFKNTIKSILTDILTDKDTEKYENISFKLICKFNMGEYHHSYINDSILDKSVKLITKSKYLELIENGHFNFKLPDLILKIFIYACYKVIRKHNYYSEWDYDNFMDIFVDKKWKDHTIDNPLMRYLFINNMLFNKFPTEDELYDIKNI